MNDAEASKIVNGWLGHRARALRAAASRAEHTNEFSGLKHAAQAYAGRLREAAELLEQPLISHLS